MFDIGKSKNPTKPLKLGMNGIYSPKGTKCIFLYESKFSFSEKL